MSYWQRFRQRQEDLARGADADLVRDYRRRGLLSSILLGAAWLLLYVDSRLRLQGILHSIIAYLAGACAVVSIPLWWWASQERFFLRKPDPEEPPSILKQ
jgi:hypothetical protein